MAKKIIKIAVDGYSSCGKSTLAKQLARKLGYVYIDSGAMYRAVTLFALREKYICNGSFNKDLLEENLKNIKILFKLDENLTPITFLNDENVETEIRKINVSQWVSPVSTIPKVRKRLVAMQQDLGKNKGIVMDGRDIGTTVFPDAELKLFVVSDLNVRAQRRYDEMKGRGDSVDMSEIIENLKTRDFIDQNREESPLRKAVDAVIIDNSNLNREQQLEIAYKLATEIIENDC